MVQLGTTFPRIPLPLWFWVWVGQREICIKLGRQSFHSQIQYEFNQKGSANVLARSPRSPSFSVRLCSKGSQLQLFFRSLFPDYLLLFSCSVVSNSATPWTAACHAALLSTLSRSLLKLVSIESVMPSNHLILCPHCRFPPPLNFSQHQGLFQWVDSLHRVAKVLELQHQSFQWIFRVDFL